MHGSSGNGTVYSLCVKVNLSLSNDLISMIPTGRISGKVIAKCRPFL